MNLRVGRFLLFSDQHQRIAIMDGSAGLYNAVLVQHAELLFVIVSGEQRYEWLEALTDVVVPILIVRVHVFRSLLLRKRLADDRGIFVVGPTEWNERDARI